MSNPNSIFQTLRKLQETTAGVETLRFLVDTAEGLRLLPLKEVLALFPNPTAITAPPAKPLSVKAQEQMDAMLRPVLEQLAEYVERIKALEAQCGSFHVIDFDVPEDFQPEESVAIGTDALKDGAVDRENVAVGLEAGVELEGTGNTLLGPYAGTRCSGELIDVTALGHAALAGSIGDMKNVTGVGARTRHTGNHQVVLGDTRANVYSAHATHRRSDRRDMDTVAPISLGLDFLLNVPAIEYISDFRDRYVKWDSKPVEPLALRECPTPPTVDKDSAEHQPLLIAYLADKAAWVKEERQYEQDMAQYSVDLRDWLESNRLARVIPTGKHVGSRTHLGFDANDLLKALETFGKDMAFVQDHSIKGGEAVKTHSDGELLAIAWKSIQELHARMHSQEFIDQIASALYQRHSEITSAAQAVAPVGSDLPADE